MDKVYWTNSKNQQIDVDSMDENHLRNTLKMIITGKTKNGASFDILKLIDIKKRLHDAIHKSNPLFSDYKALTFNDLPESMEYGNNDLN